MRNFVYLKLNGDMKMHIIYDTFAKKNIVFKNGELNKKCLQLGFDYTAISHITSKTAKKKQRFYLDRYVSLENKNLIFVLVDSETKKEYECLTNHSILKQLGLPYNDNDAKYVFELRRGRQNWASIGGRLFYLKSRPPLKACTITKVTSSMSRKMRKIKTIQSKLVRLQRSKISFLIRKNMAVKCQKTIELIGCSPEELMNYLESKFQKGMNWENYGKFGWHVDHIRPCASFDFTNKEEQKKCFHYTNLQPLWAKDNWSKNDYWDEKKQA